MNSPDNDFLTEARRLAKTLPDHPLWVEARSLLLSGHCTILGSAPLEEGSVVCATEIPLAAVIGRPEPGLVREAVSLSRPGWELLVQEESMDAVGEALPGITANVAVIHRLEDLGRLPRITDTSRVRLLSPKDRYALGHLPRKLAEELTDALIRTPVAARFLEGRPVSFCYARALTESHWDISIDTLERYRRRGFASECLVFMIRFMKHVGKDPVWGASYSNSQSISLALKLGFSSVGRLFVFSEI